MTDDFTMLSERLRVDWNSGQLFWKVKTNRTSIGDVASRKNSYGYFAVNVCGRRYLAHRVVWMLHYGEWPNGNIDHINCDKMDNRVANLRLATYQQNSANRPRITTRLNDLPKGVHPGKHGGFVARIKSGKKGKYLGTYPTPELAHDAYMAEARKIWGEFARAA